MSFEEAFTKVSRKRIDLIYRIPLVLVPESIGWTLMEMFLNRSLMQYDALCTFLAKHGMSLMAFLSSPAYSSMTENDRKDVISFFFQVCSMYECIGADHKRQSITFFDEGFIQKSYMFVSQKEELGKNRSVVHEYLRHVPLPDILVVLNTDLTLCYERLRKRPRGLTERMKRLTSKDEVMKFLERSEVHMIDVLTWLRGNSNTHIIGFQNNEPVNEYLPLMFDQINKSIQELLLGRTS